ncbi:MAG: hypothetical protein DRN35_05590 [Thermoplasmata archaeon]|nr:MAG: hypothetical protein DRN35_05590 [Thermoplasmata archaeon]
MMCGTHPDGQDISGEADWMQGNGIGEVAQDLVIRAFGRHDITLHIDVRYAPADQRLACILGNKFPADDGCMGGGEGNIPYSYMFYRSLLTKTPHFNEYYKDQNYFSIDRREIFHYCIIYHYQDDDTGIWGSGHIGTAYVEADDDFGLAAQAIKKTTLSGSYATHLARTFMHEIGHNFGLHDDTGGYMDDDQEGVNTVDYTMDQWNIVMNTLPIRRQYWL